MHTRVHFIFGHLQMFVAQQPFVVIQHRHMNKSYIPSEFNYQLKSGKSRIHGTGAFATVPIPARRKIGTLGGQVVSLRVARQRASKLEAVAIVELNNGKAIDATHDTGTFRYINHSCQPNVYMRVLGYQVEFYALRDIRPGEELKCRYYQTHHYGTKRCQCGEPGCERYL